MKRSVQVSAPLLAAAALALLSGCRKPDMQRCVDEQNRVVPDNFCQNPQTVRSPNGSYMPIYRPYYGGYGGFAIGSPATGGGYSPAFGHSYSSSTSRGGFGSSMGGGTGSGSSSSGSGS